MRSSKDHLRRAKAAARLAKTAQTPAGKQMFLAQQQKLEGLAKLAQQEESRGLLPGNGNRNGLTR